MATETLHPQRLFDLLDEELRKRIEEYLVPQIRLYSDVHGVKWINTDKMAVAFYIQTLAAGVAIDTITQIELEIRREELEQNGNESIQSDV